MHKGSIGEDNNEEESYNNSDSEDGSHENELRVEIPEYAIPKKKFPKKQGQFETGSKNLTSIKENETAKIAKL